MKASEGELLRNQLSEEVDKVVSEVIRKGVTVSSTEIARALLDAFDVRLRVPQEEETDECVCGHNLRQHSATGNNECLACFALAKEDGGLACTKFRRYAARG